MKPYLVFSDSHGNPTNMEKVFNSAQGLISGVIFLGDGIADFERIRIKASGIDTYCVRGNCDFSSEYVRSAFITLKGHRIFITHGDAYGRASVRTVSCAAIENKCEAALFGHTHVRFCGYENGIALMNPGSISFPRDGLPPSCGIIYLGGSLEFKTISASDVLKYL